MTLNEIGKVFPTVSEGRSNNSVPNGLINSSVLDAGVAYESLSNKS